MSPTTVPSTGRDGGRDARLRPVIVLLSSLLAIVVAFLGSGAVVGTPITEAAGGYLDADSTLIAPGAGAFRIWSVIYTGMLALAIWQALPGQRRDRRQRRLGWWVAASLGLNALWILVVQADQLALSLLVIVALSAVLARMLLILEDEPPTGRLEALLVDGSIGLYLGRVVVATAANATAVLVAYGFDGFGLPPALWATLVLAVTAAVGVALAVRTRGRIAPALSLTWGLAWGAIARLTDEPFSPVTGVLAILAAAALAAATIAARLRRR